MELHTTQAPKSSLTISCMTSSFQCLNTIWCIFFPWYNHSSIKIKYLIIQVQASFKIWNTKMTFLASVLSKVEDNYSPLWQEWNKLNTSCNDHLALLIVTKSTGNWSTSIFKEYNEEGGKYQIVGRSTIRMHHKEPYRDIQNIRLNKLKKKIIQETHFLCEHLTYIQSDSLSRLF